MRRNGFKAVRKVSIANAERRDRMAVEETKMGRAGDKTRKNLLCVTRTPGVEDMESRAGDGITKPSHFVRPLHCCLVGYFRIA